jgi:hypothetical protein
MAGMTPCVLIEQGAHPMAREMTEKLWTVRYNRKK